MNEVIEYAEQVILDYPDLRQEITELVQLCKCEIDEGNDITDVITICFQGIREFVEA